MRDLKINSFRGYHVLFQLPELYQLWFLEIRGLLCPASEHISKEG